MSDYKRWGSPCTIWLSREQGLQSQAEPDMKAIWCAANRNKGWMTP